MKLNIEDVRGLLTKIVHPENGKNIVELGMIDQLSITDNSIDLVLLFEKPNDPFLGSIKRECKESIAKLAGKEYNLKVLTKLREKPEAQKKDTPIKPLAEVKNIIAVASGKGGVGKSTISVHLAIALARAGYKVGLIDADIFGPSIPKMFGAEGERPSGVKRNGKDYILPIEKFGVKILSVGFFVDPEDALVWRGPLASGALKQLINDTEWGELDYLLIDLPPGTSDIHLTLVQTVAVTGAVIVSTPQDVALADARKAVGMFATKGIEVPVLGMVENMAWFTPEELPNNKYYIFGNAGCKQLASKLNLPFLGEIPIVQSVREAGDNGNPTSEFINKTTLKLFDILASNMLKQLNIRNKSKNPTKIVEIKEQ